MRNYLCSIFCNKNCRGRVSRPAPQGVYAIDEHPCFQWFYQRKQGCFVYKNICMSKIAGAIRDGRPVPYRNWCFAENLRSKIITHYALTLSVVPSLSAVDICLHRNGEIHRTEHLLTENFRSRIFVMLRCLNDKFIVYLQDQTRVKLFFL